MEIDTNEKVKLLNDYWSAANYLSVAQIYLQENVLLKQPLKAEHIKPRLLGHWGTSPGLSFIYTHLNRLIKDTDADLLFMAGPGHGAPAILANVYLEGSYTRVYPETSLDNEGLSAFVRQFSVPGGIPSHVDANTPGSIHEGGELGYALAHAFGAVFDHPDLIVACVIGDGEAETGPLAGSWKSIHFLNPARDGAVLPILHLNGYKIASPTVMGRSTDRELAQFFRSQGYEPYFVEGNDPMAVHPKMIEALDSAYRRIRNIQDYARQKDNDILVNEPWPVIVLRSPKGWTGPKEWNEKEIEGSFRAHQVPLEEVKSNPQQLEMLERWLKSYRPEDLFDDEGKLAPVLQQVIPKQEKCMGLSPYANGGLLIKDLQLPTFTLYALDVPEPGQVTAEATKNLGKYLRDVFIKNEDNFRLFCPDETNSNRLNAVFEATNRCTMLPVYASDENLATDGRVMEVLSEHLCQGWLEGYLLTGRHGIFPCYEAFVTIVDSMFNQHAKWIKTSNELGWRAPVASLNYLLSSHSWRQDHNGYSHQGPGFIDTVVNKKSSVVRIYFPPDANCLLSITNHCLKSKNYVNVIVAGKQPELQWLDIHSAVKHCTRGASDWEWAGNTKNNVVDVVVACVGDVPTLEAVAAVWLLRKHIPELKVRLVNIVNLMTLPPRDVHPHGLDDPDFEQLFGLDLPVIFAFHGYVRLIHDLVHGRPNPERFHVRGYMEEGTTTTPFDMVVLNRISRYHLAIESLKRAKVKDQQKANEVIRLFELKLQEHSQYIRVHLKDMPEIEDWKWDVTFS